MAVLSTRPPWQLVLAALFWATATFGSPPSWSFTLNPVYTGSSTSFLASYPYLPDPKPRWYTEYGDGSYAFSSGDSPGPAHAYAALGSYVTTAWGNKKNDNAPPAKASAPTSPVSPGSSTPAALPLIDQSWNAVPDEEVIFPVTVGCCDQKSTYTVVVSSQLTIVDIYCYEEIAPGNWQRKVIPNTGGTFTHTPTASNPTFYVLTKCATGSLNTTFSISIFCGKFDPKTGTGGSLLAKHEGRVAAYPYDPNFKSADVDLLTEASTPPVLTYTVGFENIGLGTAQDVVVEDDLSDPHYVLPVLSATPPASPCGFSMSSLGTAHTFSMTGINLPQHGTDEFSFQVAAQGLTAGGSISNTASIVFYDVSGNPMDPIQTNTSVIPIIGCADFCSVPPRALAEMSPKQIAAAIAEGQLSMDCIYFAWLTGLLDGEQLHATLILAYENSCASCGCCTVGFDQVWDWLMTGEVPLPALWAVLFSGSPNAVYRDVKNLFANAAELQGGWKRRLKLIAECFPLVEERLRQPATTGLATSPNPTSDMATARFFIKESAGATATLTLFDLSGRAVAEPLAALHLAEGEHYLPLQLGGLRPGLYLLRLKTDHETRTVRLVKQ